MKKPAQQQVRSRKLIVRSLGVGRNACLSSIFHLLSSNSGFTLIEVLVAATILATLIGGVLLTLNPVGQITKSQDAQRMSDIQQVKNAVDLYYSDNKCYPQQIPFGNEWRVNSTVYMKKVPQDPKCNGGNGTCYKYRTDTTASCPQWNVIFAQISKNSSLTNACPLSSLSNCTPAGYSSGAWACTLSGPVNCDNLASAASITGGIESVNPTATPTPLPSSTPTPTPTPDPNAVSFPLTQGGNPDMKLITLNPLWPLPSTQQTITVKVSDATSKIAQVQVVVTSDGNSQTTVDLKPPTGDPNNNGDWTYRRVVGGTETYNQTYDIELFAKDAAGNLGTAALPIRNKGK